MMRRFAILLLTVAAANAFAQTEKEPAPAEQRPQASERRPLNLKLENPSSWARETPEAAKDQRSGTLPTLGGDARTMPAEIPRDSSRTPYPNEPHPFQ